MSLIDLSTKQFCEQLASQSPTPGGGSVAAIEVYYAINLTEMVCRLTLTSKKYEQYHDDVNIVLNNIAELKENIKLLCDKDAESYDKVAKAIELPKDNDEQKLYRSNKIQEGLKVSIDAPLQTMLYALKVVEIIDDLIDKSNKNVVSDLGVAILSAKSGLLGASMNVSTNLNSIKDENYVLIIKQKQSCILDMCNKKIDKLLEIINQLLA